MATRQIPNLKFIASLLWLCCFEYNSNAQTILDTPTVVVKEGVVLKKTSFRGLSVVSDRVIWVSGSRGTYGLSTDSGRTFTYSQLAQYPKSDFRDIEAFSEYEAVMMSSGTPALILRTADGGQTWQEVFRQNDSAYFLDAMDFWDKRKGVIIGDPINGRFVILRTKDGGRNWTQLDTTQSPLALPDEAIFAASGTSLRCLPRQQTGFVTGGAISRFVLLAANGKTLQSRKLPIIQGKNSQGTFSFDYDERSGLLLFTGGDYLNDTSSTASTFYYSYLKQPNKELWLDERIGGYASCIEITSHSTKRYGTPTFIATGTSGTFNGHLICTYIGIRYNTCRIMQEGFHVVRKAKQGKAIFMAGSAGRVAKLR